MRDRETIIFGTIFREINPQAQKIWGINRLSDSWAHPASIPGLCHKTICLQVEHVPHFHPSQHNSCFYSTRVPRGDQQTPKSLFHGGLQNHHAIFISKIWYVPSCLCEEKDISPCIKCTTFLKLQDLIKELPNCPFSIRNGMQWPRMWTSTKSHPAPPKHCLEKSQLVGGFNYHVLPPWFPTAETGPFPSLTWVAEGRAAPTSSSWKGNPAGRSWEMEEVAPALERGPATAVAPEAPQQSREMGKERRFRGCHGSGSMGPWQESRKYSLQAYSWSLVTKKICENSCNKFTMNLSNISILWSQRNTQVPAHWESCIFSLSCITL